jgi:hypothetical protein
MDRRLLQLVGSDTDRINFDPGKRQQLIERYALAASAAGSDCTVC